MSASVIESKAIVKNYGGFTALNNVNITIKRGEIYGLVGDNGAGKSTLFKIIAGQVIPNGGEICLFGEHLPKNLEQQRKRTGAIIESPGFYPQLSVENNLEYYRIQKGVPGREIVKKLLETVNLYNSRKKKCKELSMGMKQRFGLAIALLGEPELLILDEPINGLDPSGIIEMRKLLLMLNMEKNITILLSSHILSELEQLASVYGFLNEGKLLEQISASNLRKRCSDYIEILVSDFERYAALLEKKLNHKQFQVLPDNVIRISNPKLEIEVFSRLASDNNMSISKLEKKQMSLENYYMTLKNGGASSC